MATDALLSVKGLVKKFGGLTATDGVDLDVAEGEIHAIIGPNGAGKTRSIGSSNRCCNCAIKSLSLARAWCRHGMSCRRIIEVSMVAP